MSEKLPALAARDLIRILRRHGFEFVRSSGSHQIFRHIDGRQTTIPVHGKYTVGKGLLAQILHDTGLTSRDLRG